MTWATTGMVLAPLETLKRFAAWHLELGATRVTLYLDDADQEKAAALSQNPRVRPILCNEKYWRTLLGRRPDKFQVRQVANATHAYNLSSDVDWLAHIDVDEFMLPEEGSNVQSALDGIESGFKIARMTMVESLAPDQGDLGGRMYFKAFHQDREKREAATNRVYGRYGPYLNGGFLGHLQGKIFVRTRVRDLTLRIHLAGVNGLPLRETALNEVSLAHLHAPTRDLFLSHMRHRLREGSYRQDNPNVPAKRVSAIVRRRDLLQEIDRDEGEAGLLRFFDAIGVAREPLLSNLRAEELLREHMMDFDEIVARHFDQ